MQIILLSENTVLVDEEPLLEKIPLLPYSTHFDAYTAAPVSANLWLLQE
jgi:hypothetical protein